jgi:hypothetical protein
MFPAQDFSSSLRIKRQQNQLVPVQPFHHLVFDSTSDLVFLDVKAEIRDRKRGCEAHKQQHAGKTLLHTSNVSGFSRLIQRIKQFCQFPEVI